jgi:hypothetical protein
MDFRIPDSALLPFRRDQDKVDHILVVSVLMLRDKDALPQSFKV